MENISTEIEHALLRLDGAYAPNTLRSYYVDATTFVDWCHKQNVEVFPLTSATLSDYIEFMKLGLRYSTIRRRISSIRRINTLLGYQDKTQTEEIYLAIRRLKREKLIEQMHLKTIHMYMIDLNT